jgi:hypothetical protein
VNLLAIYLRRMETSSIFQAILQSKESDKFTFVPNNDYTGEMKKLLILLCAILFIFNTCHSQRDSVHTLFSSSPHIKIPLKYSYLQWDLGYTGFLFSNNYVNGYSLDVIGLVFNEDLDIAAGFEGGGSNYGYVPIGMVASYSAVYIKFVPMLFPDKLINFSMPLKFSYSSLDVSNSNNPAGYGGRRGRGRGFPGEHFFSFTPGADVFINVFHFLSLGAGINYRFAFSTPGSYSWSDYNNASLSLIARLKLYPKKRNKPPSDYYAPPQQRFNQ